MPANHMLYQVTVKALLFKDGKLLTLITPTGYLDFPGGRVDTGERDLTWEESLEREVAEELGADLRIKVGETAFVTKRAYTSGGTAYAVAAIYFWAEYQSGQVALSDEHAHFEWVNPATLATADYKFVSEDERRQIRAYFASRQ
ncbi:MAG TPA: NUDIX domain-containing protein [Candidatus Saccharimonadales bacterium]|jgi:8-oxo-dGTP pyrophosphatase MutT (NUDIX family)